MEDKDLVLSKDDYDRLLVSGTKCGVEDDWLVVGGAF